MSATHKRFDYTYTAVNAFGVETEPDKRSGQPKVKAVLVHGEPQSTNPHVPLRGLQHLPRARRQRRLTQNPVITKTTEGNEAARQTLLGDPDRGDLRDMLEVACTLMGQDFPELAAWRQEIHDESQRKPFMFGGSAPTPTWTVS